MTLSPEASVRARAARLSTRAQLRLLATAAGAVVGLAALIWLIGLLGRGGEPAKPADPSGTFTPTAAQLKMLTFERVGAGFGASETNATGAIEADGDLSTPVLLPYSGQVAKVLVDAGQVVAAGQPLLIVRTGEFVDARNALFSSEATLGSARAQVANARRTAERTKALFESAGGPRKDYQQALTDLAAAEAQQRSAEAAVGAARDKLAIFGKSAGEIRRLETAREITGLHEETTLHAPIGGTIASRDVSPGQYVGAGGDKPVLTITDPSRVWLIAQLPESDTANVHVGDRVEVTTPAWPGRIFHAVIDNVGAGLDPNTHRLPVRATIANPDQALKPQMFASFAIRHVDQRARLTVPGTAVIHEGESARLWVLRPDRRLEARMVRTGQAEGDEVEITAGLRPGETVVTAGALFVNEAGLGA